MSYALAAEPPRGSRRWSHLCEPGLSPHRSNPTPPTDRDASATTGGRRVPRRNEPETRQAPLCSAGTSRLSRRSERTRHALDSMPGPSVRSGLVHGAHTNLIGLADAIRWQAWTHERTRDRDSGPKPATRDQPGRGRKPNEPEPGRRAPGRAAGWGSTAPVLALAGLSRGDSRTNPRGYGQGTASAAACNGVIAAAPLRLDLAPASRHLQVSLHPRALVRKEAGWPRKT